MCFGKGEMAIIRVNFQLKYMVMFVAFDHSSLPYVAEFSNHLHTDEKLQNQPMH